jgi:hypothetical protein
MAVKTYAVQLEEVQTAIASIEAGSQSQSMNSRSITRANLADLYAREKWLRTMADREERGGIGVNYVIYT